MDGYNMTLCEDRRQLVDPTMVGETGPLEKVEGVLEGVVVRKEINESSFGLVIMGGTDAAYIDNRGRKSKRVKIKKVRNRSAASRTSSLKAGQEIARVNGVSVEGKSHDEIVDLIRSSGNEMSLDLHCSDQSDDEAEHQERILSLKQSRESRKSRETRLSSNSNMQFGDNDNHYEIEKTKMETAKSEMIASAQTASNCNNNIEMNLSEPIMKPVLEGLNDEQHSVLEGSVFNGAYMNILRGNETPSLGKSTNNTERTPGKQPDVSPYLAAIEKNIETLQELIEDEQQQYQQQNNNYSPTLCQHPTEDFSCLSSRPSSHFPSPSALPCPSPSADPRSSPVSMVFWGALASHIMEPSVDEGEWKTPPTSPHPLLPQGLPSPIMQKDSRYGIEEQLEVTTSSPPNNHMPSPHASSSKTASPYHIPTPSTPGQAFDADRAASAATPYPVIYPQRPEEVSAPTPFPPDVAPMDAVRDAVEATAFERPMTAWSINDPTTEKSVGKNLNFIPTDTEDEEDVITRRKKDSESPAVTDDHMYLFVGTLAVLAASGMLASFLYRRKVVPG